MASCHIETSRMWSMGPHLKPIAGHSHHNSLPPQARAWTTIVWGCISPCTIHTSIHTAELTGITQHGLQQFHLCHISIIRLSCGQCSLFPSACQMEVQCRHQTAGCAVASNTRTCTPPLMISKCRAHTEKLIRGDARQGPSDSPRQLQVLWHCRAAHNCQANPVTLCIVAKATHCCKWQNTRGSLMVTRFACIAHRLQSSNKCTMKSSVACDHQGGMWEGLQATICGSARLMQRRCPTSCMARRASAVQRNGSGANVLVISRHCNHVHL